MFEKDNFEKNGTREYCIFQVAKILYELYIELNKTKPNAKLYYRPAIKCQNIAHNCGPVNFDGFKEQCMKKDDIINFTLSTSYIVGEDEEDEYNDWCKITVVFDINKDTIEIYYLKEFENELFDESINKIKECLKGQKAIFKNKKRKKPVRVEMDIGVLGKYMLHEFETDEYFETEEGYNRFFKRIMKDYAENIDLINNKIVYQMYMALVSTAYPLWEYDEFYKIIDKDKLPAGFENMSNKEKSDLLYKNFEYDEENIITKLKENVPFLNVDKFKDDINITNITINKKPKDINIEFNGICNFFTAMITLEYDKNYKVREFHVS